MSPVINPYLKKKKPAALGGTHHAGAGKGINAKQPAQPPRKIVAPTAQSKQPMPSSSFPSKKTVVKSLMTAQTTRNPNHTLNPKQNASLITPTKHLRVPANAPTSSKGNKAQRAKPTKKGPLKLKANLKREIAMLKRQKAEKVLAKKRKQAALIQEQKRKEREALLMKHMQEKKLKEEERLKMREKQIMEQKEILQRSLASRGLEHAQGTDKKAVVNVSTRGVEPLSVIANSINAATYPMAHNQSHSEGTLNVVPCNPANIGALSIPTQRQAQVISAPVMPMPPQRQAQVIGPPVMPMPMPTTQHHHQAHAAVISAPIVPIPLQVKHISVPAMPAQIDGQAKWHRGQPHAYPYYHQNPYPYQSLNPNMAYTYAQQHHGNAFPLPRMPPQPYTPQGAGASGSQYLQYPVNQNPYQNVFGVNASRNRQIPTPRPRQPKKILPKDMILHKPLVHPSPFAKNYSMLAFKIVILKKPGESFGINLRYVQKGTLVEVPDLKEGPKMSNMNTQVVMSHKSTESSSVAVQVASIDSDVMQGSQQDDQKETKVQVHVANQVDSETSGAQSQIKPYIDTKPSVENVEKENDSKKIPPADTSGLPCSDPPTISDPIPEPEDQITNKSQHPDESLGKGMQQGMIPTSSTYIASKSDDITTAVRKQRKRIQKFGVMSVITADIQNNRAKAGTPQDRLLQSGDIILDINGKDIANMIFHDATKLFGKRKEYLIAKDTTNSPAATVLSPQHNEGESNNNPDIVLECVLTVARERRVTKILNKLNALENLPAPKIMIGANNTTTKATFPVPTSAAAVIPSTSATPLAALVPTKIPFMLGTRSRSVISGDLSDEELRALIFGMKAECGNFDETIFTRLIANPTYRNQLVQRTQNDLKLKWELETRSIDQSLTLNASNIWKQEWDTEAEDEQDEGTSVAFLSPSQKSILRNTPRPSRGCKCGSLDHQYVNDSKCVLYRNLRIIAKPSMMAEELKMEGGYSQSLGKYNGKLNSIGNAHVQRLMKKNEEEKAEEVEAKFVDAMERIQTLELGMAVFAPRILSVMILSAIAAMSVNVEGHCVKDGTCNTGCDESDNDDDDDDDVLLMTLGRKRQGHSDGIHQSSAKKHRGEKSISMPNSYCMARILSHISKTWGHLYWQPTQSENAW